MVNSNLKQYKSEQKQIVNGVNTIDIDFEYDTLIILMSTTSHESNAVLAWVYDKNKSSDKYLVANMANGQSSWSKVVKNTTPTSNQSLSLNDTSFEFYGTKTYYMTYTASKG